jgi:putative DNA primase/helicase
MSTLGRWADARWRATRLRDEAHDAAAPSLVKICASEVEMQPVTWLWPGRIAKGKHTAIAGEPGTGKSQLAVDIIATITMGCEWPCGAGRAPQGSALILSAEDAANDTIVPRLHAARADLGRVTIIKAVADGKAQRTFNLQRDLALLEAEVTRQGDVSLIVIDPISSYLGKGPDSHKNADVRAVLEPVSEFAERLKVAILTITHFSKSGSNTPKKALHRFIGSIAFVGAPRIALVLVEEEGSERRLLLHAKNNLAMPPQGLAFTIRQSIVGANGQGIVASRVAWDPEPVTVTADEALAVEAAASPKGHQREEAKDFLQQLLADGPVGVDHVNKQAGALGLTPRTLKRARADLGVIATKGAFEGGWALSLPPKKAFGSDERE